MEQLNDLLEEREQVLKDLVKLQEDFNLEFVPFPKIARLHREVVITEKIDGTNASITIEQYGAEQEVPDNAIKVWQEEKLFMLTASRTKWITPKDDNFGFANWAYTNADELIQLGPGTHFGEWWGKGIQRNYGLNEKRFSLFNTSKWTPENAPRCCSVVPVLYRGMFNEEEIWNALWDLNNNGSKASPGFKPAEGVIIYHTAGNLFFKKTIVKDEEYKSKSR